MERMVLEEQGSKVLNRFVWSALPDTWGMVGRTDSFFNTVFWWIYTQTHTKPRYKGLTGKQKVFDWWIRILS